MKYLETLKIIFQERDLKFSLESSQAPRIGTHGCCVKTLEQPQVGIICGMQVRSALPSSVAFKIETTRTQTNPNAIKLKSYLLPP